MPVSQLISRLSWVLLSCHLLLIETICARLQNDVKIDNLVKAHHHFTSNVNQFKDAPMPFKRNNSKNINYQAGSNKTTFLRHKRSLTSNNNDNKKKNGHNHNHDEEQKRKLFMKHWDDIENHEREKHYRRPYQSRFVDYGGSHPYEIMRLNRSKIQSTRNIQQQNTDTINVDINDIDIDRDLQLAPWAAGSDAYYDNIRIHIDTHYIDIEEKNGYGDQIKFVKDEILPKVVTYWQSAIKVYRTQGPIVVDPNICPAYSSTHITPGISNTDLVIYVAANLPNICQSGALAAGRSCQADQYDRATAGTAVLCLDILQEEGESSIAKYVSILTHEFAHIFGMRALDFAYYYNPITGLPRTTRPLKEEFVTCVDDFVQKTVLPSTDTLKMGYTNRNNRYYEIVTPTVVQAARNQFDCQSMTGARLENQPTNNGNCFGTHWEARLYAGDLLSAISTSLNQVVTPMTMALLEDSGWYKVDYSFASISTFGHNSGCPFVYEDCIQDGKVPDWGKSFFCNDLLSDTSKLHCDSTHTQISRCDLVDFLDYPNSVPPKPSYQYFPDHPTWGGLLHTAEYCPMNNLVVKGSNANGIFEFKCTDPELQSSVAPEFFGPDSKCFETNLSRPLCMKVKCDETSGKVVVMIKSGNSFISTVCNADGEKKDIPGMAFGSQFTCPNRDNICPDFGCPNNCKGRGYCDHSQSPPKCKCCNTNDTTADCSDSIAGCFTEIDPKPPATNSGNLYCGSILSDAARCDDSSRCPGGLDSECDVGEKCYSVTQCITPTGNFYCGTSLDKASTCVEGTECPSGSDSECAPGETCHDVSMCISVKGDHYCGLSLADASQCKAGSECPSGLDIECDDGEKCYTNPVCTTPNSHYCGSSLETASECLQGTECPTTLDQECNYWEKCYKVTECKDPTPTKLFCGSTKEKASACIVGRECFSGLDNECPYNEKCYPVDSCMEPTGQPSYCGSSIEEASTCSDGSECTSDYDCDDSSTCFPVDKCLESNKNYYCGSSLKQAQICDPNSNCSNNPCPYGQLCYEVDTCDTVISRPGYCGTSPDSAAQCLEDKKCDIGCSEDYCGCSADEQCYEVDTCFEPPEPKDDYYCGTNLLDARKCDFLSTCNNGICPSGLSCFNVDAGNCIVDDTTRYCGTSLLKASECIPEKKCTEDSECSGDELCFAIKECVEGGDEVSLYCGTSQYEAQQCNPESECPNGRADCPSDQECFQVSECNASDQPQLSKGQYFCGSSLEEASMCNNADTCPSGLDVDCNDGEKCFFVNACDIVQEPSDLMYCGASQDDVTEITNQKCSSGSDSECENGEKCYFLRTDGNLFCGKSIDDASKCESSKACPSGLNNECDVGEECFDVDKCDFTHYCGWSLKDAGSCNDPCNSFDDCATGQSCFPIPSNICKASQGFVNSMFCGESKQAASLCSGKPCPSGLSIECNNGEECYDIMQCLDSDKMFCGKSYLSASYCRENNKCPSGLNSECEDGETCYHVQTCRESNVPTSMPTPKARSQTQVNYSFCVEHGILKPVYKVAAETQAAIQKIMTQLFDDDIQLVENEWDIPEKHLRVISANTKWLPDGGPDKLQCQCVEGDGEATCSALSTDAVISYWSELEEKKIMYLLLAFVQYIMPSLPYKVTYWGFVAVSTEVQMEMYGLPYGPMPDDSKETLSEIVKTYLNEDLDSLDVKGLEILAVDIIDVINLATERNLRKLNEQGVQVSTRITGWYKPPPTFDFDAAVANSIRDGGQILTNRLLNSGDSYFSTLSGIGLTDVKVIDKQGDTLDDDITYTPGSNSKVGMIIGILCGIFVLAALSAGGFIYYKRKRQYDEQVEGQDIFYRPVGDKDSYYSRDNTYEDRSRRSSDYEEEEEAEEETFLTRGNTFRTVGDDTSVMTDPTYRGGAYPDDNISQSNVSKLSFGTAQHLYDDDDGESTLTGSRIGPMTGNSINTDGFDDVSLLPSVLGVEELFRDNDDDTTSYSYQRSTVQGIEDVSLLPSEELSRNISDDDLNDRNGDNMIVVPSVNQSDKKNPTDNTNLLRNTPSAANENELEVYVSNSETPLEENNANLLTSDPVENQLSFYVGGQIVEANSSAITIPENDTDPNNRNSTSELVVHSSSMNMNPVSPSPETEQLLLSNGDNEVVQGQGDQIVPFKGASVTKPQNSVRSLVLSTIFEDGCSSSTGIDASAQDASTKQNIQEETATMEYVDIDDGSVLTGSQVGPLSGTSIDGSVCEDDVSLLSSVVGVEKVANNNNIDSNEENATPVLNNILEEAARKEPQDGTDDNVMMRYFEDRPSLPSNDIGEESKEMNLIKNGSEMNLIENGSESLHHTVGDNTFLPVTETPHTRTYANVVSGIHTHNDGGIEENIDADDNGNNINRSTHLQLTNHDETEVDDQDSSIQINDDDESTNISSSVNTGIWSKSVITID